MLELTEADPFGDWIWAALRTSLGAGIYRLIDSDGCIHDEVILRRQIIGVARQRNTRALTQLKRHVVAPIEQLKDSLKRVIAI